MPIKCQRTGVFRPSERYRAGQGSGIAVLRELAEPGVLRPAATQALSRIATIRGNRQLGSVSWRGV